MRAAPPPRAAQRPHRCRRSHGRGSDCRWQPARRSARQRSGQQPLFLPPAASAPSGGTSAVVVEGKGRAARGEVGGWAGGGYCWNWHHGSACCCGLHALRSTPSTPLSPLCCSDAHDPVERASSEARRSGTRVQCSPSRAPPSPLLACRWLFTLARVRLAAVPSPPMCSRMALGVAQKAPPAQSGRGGRADETAAGLSRQQAGSWGGTLPRQCAVGRAVQCRLVPSFTGPPHHPPVLQLTQCRHGSLEIGVHVGVPHEALLVRAAAARAPPVARPATPLQLCGTRCVCREAGSGLGKCGATSGGGKGRRPPRANKAALQSDLCPDPTRNTYPNRCRCRCSHPATPPGREGACWCASWCGVESALRAIGEEGRRALRKRRQAAWRCGRPAGGKPGQSRGCRCGTACTRCM